MTLLELAAEIDALIVRLTAARAHLASLRPMPELPSSPVVAPSSPAPRRRGRPRKHPEAIETPTAMPELPSPATTAEASSEAAPTTPEPTRAPRRRNAPVEPSALSSRVPLGPVAVPASAVPHRPAKHTPARPAESAPAKSGHSLEDLVRELRHRQPAPITLEA